MERNEGKEERRLKKYVAVALLSVASLSLVACQPVDNLKQEFNVALQEEIEKQKMEEADKMLAEEAERIGELSDFDSTDEQSEMDSSANTESSTALESEQESVEDVLIDVMYDSLTELEAENIDGYMAYLSLTPENYEYNYMMNQRLVEKYDIKYTLEDIAVYDVTPTTAKVKVTQTTERVGGAEDFTDNKSVFIHHMVLEDSQWKFAGSEVVSTEYLY